MGKGIKAEETIIVFWRMTVNSRPINQEVIFYSKSGIQYACTKFTNILSANEFVKRRHSALGYKTIKEFEF